MLIIQVVITYPLFLVDGEEISSIGRGVLALIGMTRGDSEKDVHYM